MHMSMARMCALLTSLATLLSACGGGSSSSSSTAAPAAPAATTASMANSSGAMNNAPTMPMAAMPATLKCATPVVWVNMRTKTYHMAGDPYYGRTRSGAYMCQGDAEAHGYRMAGTPRMHTGSMMTSPAPAST
jgi:hypothetical protein